MKKFFHKIVSFLHKLFTNVDEWIHEHVQPSIETVQRIKYIVDGVIGDIVVLVIPGDADDKIRDWISVNLSKALQAMQLGNNILNAPNIETKISYLIDMLRQLSPNMRNAFYMKIASEMAKSSGNDENVKGHSVDLLVQMQYSKLVANIKAEDLPEDKYTIAAKVVPPAKVVAAEKKMVAKK